MASVVMALTGEPGAGKSTAVHWFSAHGAAVLDADQIVRTLWTGEDLPQAARERWGNSAFQPDGKINKKTVSQIIFSDEEEYRWLCGKIFPVVYEEMRKNLPCSGISVVEIPMLFEAGRPEWVDRVLFMTADSEIRVRRNSFRGLDAVELSRREKFFLSREERIKRSDWVICNDGDLEKLYISLQKIWAILKSLEQKASNT
jgi:dephospho-CoA kinase